MSLLQRMTLNVNSGLEVMFESSNSIMWLSVAQILYFLQRNFSLKQKMLEETATSLCHSEGGGNTLTTTTTMMGWSCDHVCVISGSQGWTPKAPLF